MPLLAALLLQLLKFKTMKISLLCCSVARCTQLSEAADIVNGFWQSFSARRAGRGCAATLLRYRRLYGMSKVMNIYQRAVSVQEALQRRYPEPQTHLTAETPWQLLVAVVLSAQCTDARVNMVTPELFRRWPGPGELASAAVEDVEDVVRSTGFFHNKARNIVAAAQRVVGHFRGEVPRTLAELITLPGVARKTANVVLWGAFGLNEGIAVDTHVGRICRRLGLTAQTSPVAVERELMLLFPREEWGRVNHRLVWFGRQVCAARKPLCQQCEMLEFCPQLSVDSAEKRR